MNDPLFCRGDIITHVKTGKGYVILREPNKFLRLEHCNEPFYVYRSYGEHTVQVLWYRCQSEMEDGRFVKTQR